MLNVLSLRISGQERKGAELKIEVLYFKGCPHHQPAVAQVRQALSVEGIDIPVYEVWQVGGRLTDFDGSRSDHSDLPFQGKTAIPGLFLLYID